MKNKLLLLIVTAFSLVACSSIVSIPLPEGVSVWGGRIKDGSKMPFAAGFEASLDDNRSNQVAPLLLTSDGRYVWSDTPFSFRITDNAIVITEGKVTVEKAGDSLSDAFKAASGLISPPTGRCLPQSSTGSRSTIPGLNLCTTRTRKACSITPAGFSQTACPQA